MSKYDLVVIGAGAAGLMTAALAAENGAKVLLLEKMEKVGRKIRITGKGRCNLTNNKSHEEFMSKIKAGAEFIEPAFNRFDNVATIAFFERIGVPIAIEQGGRAYPKSGDAWDIANSLERYCKKNGCEIWCNSIVDRVNVSKDGKECVGVSIYRNEELENVECDKVVIATGGVTYPATGSTGDGYSFAHELGHNIESVRPSLVPFELASKHCVKLKGLILKNITISLLVDDNEVVKEQGEVEFFDFGIGGGAVYRISRDAVDAVMDGRHVDFLIDLKPSLSIQKLLGRVQREVEALPSLTVYKLLQKLMPSQIIATVGDKLNVTADAKVARLSERDITEILTVIKNLKFKVVCHRGFKEAVVTAGGVNTNEVNRDTMESKLVKGLYFAGEVLDMDADTGGYNLQLAFSSAFVVADNFKIDGGNK